MYKKLSNKETKLAVIGLGYVGLPVALEFARSFSVVGFDINKKRVEQMKNGEDPSNELNKTAFEGKDIYFTADQNDLKDVSFFVVSVPTPIDESREPDLTPLLSATKTVGINLKKEDYVVYESTVYPGCTEEDCVPLLEKTSGLKLNKDFNVGYSPERINPGDTQNTFSSIAKIVSASNDNALEEISKVYEQVVDAGVHKASSIKVAESAKVIENTQRDVNIGLVNELSIIFNKIGVNTYDVLKAAGTKWNFLPFQPGLVGGHCIGVDPYYLTHKAKQLDYHANIINSGRFVNDSMGTYIANQTVKKVIAQGKNIKDAKALVMGATFKENVSDIRNSKVIDVIKELESFGAKVDVVDPHACPDEMQSEYGVKLSEKPKGTYDAIILAVDHEEYKKWKEDDFKQLMNNGKGVLFDVKGIFQKKMHNLTYMSL
ncbi:MAG: nucleotide sugar dehydrogenase [Flavobacteriales bacterium]